MGWWSPLEKRAIYKKGIVVVVAAFEKGKMDGNYSRPANLHSLPGLGPVKVSVIDENRAEARDSPPSGVSCASCISSDFSNSFTTAPTPTGDDLVVRKLNIVNLNKPTSIPVKRIKSKYVSYPNGFVAVVEDDGEKDPGAFIGAAALAAGYQTPPTMETPS